MLKILSSVALVALSTPSVAQQAILLDFNENPNSQRMGISSLEADMSDAARMSVAVKMLEQDVGPADNSLVWQQQLAAEDYSQVRFPTDNIQIPLWLRPGGPLPSTAFSIDRRASNFSVGSFANCDGAEFTPAPWLPKAAQQRRAVWYDRMAAVACEHGIPTDLFDAMIGQESGYNPFAVSHAGAMGMGQIMPGTARHLGLHNPFDPVANMRAGAKYLKQQIDDFGRHDLALAAYNAGPQRVRKLGRVPYISETVNYVSTITNNWMRLQRRSMPNAAQGRAEAAASAVRSYQGQISMLKFR